MKNIYNDDFNVLMNNITEELRSSEYKYMEMVTCHQHEQRRSFIKMNEIVEVALVTMHEDGKKRKVIEITFNTTLRTCVPLFEEQIQSVVVY